jgi:hypothetical protein
MRTPSLVPRLQSPRAALKTSCSHGIFPRQASNVLAITCFVPQPVFFSSLLEDTLYRLLDEFQPELTELGIEAAMQQGKPPGLFQIKPPDKLPTRMVYAKDKLNLENNQGDSFEAGGGRESLWWGPGFNGSMLFSPNTRPFDLIKIGAAEPFTLPWVFQYLGPLKLTY